jgi:hypothetical protein
MHRYLVRLKNSKGYFPENTISVLTELRKSSVEFGSVIKNLRVTETALEFDIYVLDPDRKKQTIRRLESHFGKLLSERDLQLQDEDSVNLDKSDVVRESAKLFNEQRYWECHETLEQIWRKEPKGEEKDVQQGIILAASSLVHYQKHEDEVCLGMIPRTLAKLEKWQNRMYYAIDIERLKENLEEISQSRVIRPFLV